MIHQLATTISAGEPLVKGLVTVAVISSVAVLGRQLPKQLYEFIVRKISLEIVYSKPNDKEGSMLEQNAYDQFTSHLGALSRTKIFTLDRKVTQNKGTGLTENITFGVGKTFGYFFAKGKLYTFSRKIKEGDKITSAADKITLRVFFGKKEDVKRIIPAAVADSQRYFLLTERFCERPIAASVLSEDSQIFLPSGLRKEIDTAIDYFLENKIEMLSRGIPWKLTFMFYGPPGTGKTTLIAYIAMKLKRSIMMPTESMGIAVLGQANRNNAILALEDMDCYPFAKKRVINKKLESEEDNPYSQNSAQNVQLSEFLNFLQGPGPLNGDVIVMTTNHLEKVDPAIYRPGRVDVKILVDFYKLNDLKDWVQFFYRDLYDESLLPVFPEDIQFRPGDLAELYRKNSKDLRNFYTELAKRCDEHRQNTLEKEAEKEHNALIERARHAEAAMAIHKAGALSV